jgi:hypothetical protein
MNVDQVGEVIAIRQLFVSGNPDHRIVVKMGKPTLWEAGPDYVCCIQITGIADEKVKYAVGVDAFQAIELATKLIAIELRAIRDQFEVRFARWEGDDDGCGGFGFLSAEEMVRDDRNR